MAITETNRNRAALAKRAIDDSPLNADAKADLDELIDASLAATNGLPLEEKVQAVSDGLFQLTRLWCIHVIAKPPATSWRDMVVAIRWQLTIVAIAVCALLALRPQLAAILEAVVK